MSPGCHDPVWRRWPGTPGHSSPAAAPLLHAPPGVLAPILSWPSCCLHAGAKRCGVGSSSPLAGVRAPQRNVCVAGHFGPC
ncbi:hypothetical protein VULLAG_LOCUS8556 [Vulpes lagopus]